MKDQAFYDNADARLNLPKRVSYASRDLGQVQRKQQDEKVAYLREIGVKDETDLLRVMAPNASNGQVENRMQKYIDAGFSTVDALNAAEEEIAAEREVSPDERQDIGSGTYMGASTESLMRAPVKPLGSGSRSGKRAKHDKPKKDGRGRPYVEYDEPRDVRQTVCMTATTERAIESTGVHRNDIMAAVGQAILAGKTLAEIIGPDIMSEVTARTPNKSDENRAA